MSAWSEYLHRVAGHMPQMQLAELTGINPSQISRWFTGTNQPSTENVRRLAEALDLDLNEALVAATSAPRHGNATESPKSDRSAQSGPVEPSQSKPRTRTPANPHSAPTAPVRPFPDDPARVGATIRTIREIRGYAADEFAVMIGTTLPYLTNIESGRRAITAELAQEIAERLGVPLLALVRNGPTAVTAESVGDTTTIDFGKAGTATVSLDLRLLEITADQAGQVLQLVDEFRQLGASMRAANTRTPLPEDERETAGSL